jgi:hypothetical protein
MEKRMKILVGLLLVTFAVACGQADKTFTIPVRLNAGFYVGVDPTLYLTLPTGGGGSMVYPLAGIPLSTGTAWGTSIVNNSANWNTAFGWGNHAGIYRPIAWVPTFAQVTAKPTTLAGYGITDASLATHNHSTLYKAIGWFPTWDEVTAKPATLELSVAIEQLGYLPVPQKTTAEINALVIPTGTRALVYDRTLEVLKIWNGTLWKIFPTTN